MYCSVRMAYTCVVCLLVLGTLGCQMESAGSENAARAFVDAEFTKWMSGSKNKVKDYTFSMHSLAPPIGYDVQSIVPDAPDYFAHDNIENRHRKGEEWPAYIFNVTIKFKSQAGTVLEKVVSYNVTWNVKEKKWFVREKV